MISFIRELIPQGGGDRAGLGLSAVGVMVFLSSDHRRALPVGALIQTSATQACWLIWLAVSAQSGEPGLRVHAVEIISELAQIVEELMVRDKQTLCQDGLTGIVRAAGGIADQISPQPGQQRHRRDDQEKEGDRGATGLKRHPEVKSKCKTFLDS